MSEEKMLEAVQAALDDRGIDDRLEAVGQFNPRGHTGGGFAGGLIGGDVGGVAGSLGDAVGTVAGYAAGTRAADAASGLPEWMLVGVSRRTCTGLPGGRGARSRPSSCSRCPVTASR